MLFGKEKLKFVFIGAGSASFTMSLVGDILAADFIEEAELALVDLDAAVLARVEKGVSRLLRHTGKDFRVSSHLDFRKALPEADFVFFTYATGGYAAWKKDIETCTRFNAFQSVGDTIGPGGIIRALRHIPVALEIARAMEEICPEAWIINYANPEGPQCLAIQTRTRIKSFGLCHGTPDTARDLAELVFKVDPGRLAYRAAGVNHLTWFTDLRVDGLDMYPGLEKALIESEFGQREQVSLELYRIFGLYPAPGDRHVQEFFSHFLKAGIIEERDLEWKNNDFKVVDGWREQGQRDFEKMLAGEEGCEKFLGGSGETATHFIRSLVRGDTITEMVNVVNRGYIENVSDGIIVEIPTFVDGFGLHPQKIGRLPDAIAAKCDALGREYLLAVEAAVTGDRRIALQAMMLDPIVANCDHPARLLDALLSENAGLLPDYWK
jgi:alpha-galactosidase